MIDNRTRGVFVISATPFTEDGALDLDSARRLTEFYLEKGASGLTVLGMMGEAAKLTPEESLAFLDTVLEVVAGRVPVVVGVSAPGLVALRALAHEALARGAAGVMVAPTPNLRTDQQIAGYYDLVCEALGPEVPIVLQDFPLALGVQFSVDCLVRIFAAHPQIVMLKHEDWPGLAKLGRLRALEAEGKAPHVSILVGNGGLFLPQEMARGADGAMTGYAYPEMLVQVVAGVTSGKRDAVEDVFDAHLPLIRLETQPGLGLAFRKEVLFRRGAIASPFVRRPGPKLDAEDMAELDRTLARLDRRLAALA
ncbi:dihydrodipicolinate synthase family protein [Salipiger sp. P9]|uniref:dihydrodipicolinate synthase family protein n=1 Tax=Salipiger pentaromativorans TaxID=2943193 RepID=UPI002157237E|nr:dihydrodipicolinate synthase family protein [Salipiger pentaromativorans]MCR8548974.1 dihydrodipicolinate synthase family protein [Salipiger pentaromativorans]